MKTYNDIFVEELIRRNRGAKETIIKAGAVLLVLILTFLAFIFVGVFFPFVFAVLCILLFFAFNYTVKEYEYSFINGDFDIDCILGKRKRKRVLSTNCKNIRVFAPSEKGSEPSLSDITRILNASISNESDGRWYFICDLNDSEKILVYLSPSKRLREAFKTYLTKRMKDE